MAPVKPRNYEFDASSIAVLRTRLKIKQTKMAELLGVPANTLSRWETGATKPDADSLAAIHSIALENGAAVNFFKKKVAPQPTPAKSLRVAVMADFQNLGVSANKVAKFNKHIRDAVERLFPNPKHTLFRAFTSPNQAGDTLRQNNWKVKEGRGNWDENIIQQAKAYCGEDLKGTALVLITKDGDFADLLKELKGKGVQVYLMSPANPSKKLSDLVDKKHRISWPA